MNVDWTQVLIALIVGLPLIIGAVANFIFGWKNSSKLATTEAKIDKNTEITKAGSAAAVVNAKAAVEVASSVEGKVDGLAKQMNGALEEKIKAIVKAEVKMVHDLIESHTKQDETNMLEIRSYMSERSK